MFFSGGFYSSLGAGRLLVKESIWLDSLTNCIKRQSCPWSAPQLIDGSTHSHRKSSRQNGGKSVACRCSPPSLPPSLAIYLPLPYLSSLCLFSHKCHMIQMSSKQSQIPSNLYALPRMVQTCISNTQMCLSDTLYVNLQWNWMTVSLCGEAVTKLKKSRRLCRLDEAESNSL